MAVNLKNLEAERLLNELARATGEGLTEAATNAFRERLERIKAERATQQKRALASLTDLIAEARRAPPLSSVSEKDVTDELWGER
jgi:hypothetical protein